MSKTIKSDAHLVVVPEFRIYEVKFIHNNDSVDYTFHQTDDIYFPYFPLILQSDGTLWEIANLYLVRKLETESDGWVNMKTFRGIADDLLNYLRFMEEYKLHYLALPRNERLRVTYRYRTFLTSLVRKGKIRASTAKQRMNRVVNFYRDIIKWKLINPKDLENQPYEDIERGVLTLNNKGFGKSLRIQSHNLTIKAAKKNPNPDCILDGGELRPLTLEEQVIILKALRNSRNREMQLIFYFALFTGARIQTCCTLCIKHLDGELDSEGYLRLRVGPGPGIDTKFDKNMILKVPGWLVNDLKIYANSHRATKRRASSLYGNTKENYLFLTNRGQPYYTSKQEIEDWQNLRINESVARSETAVMKVHDGATVRVFLSGLIAKIKVDHPNFTRFRFHDLRATYGMNLLEKILAKLGEKQTAMAALVEVQQCMGHSNIQTTMRYLNYRGRFNERVAVQDAFEEEILQYVTTTSDWPDQLAD
jgi:integrase